MFVPLLLLLSILHITWFELPTNQRSVGSAAMNKASIFHPSYYARCGDVRFLRIWYQTGSFFVRAGIVGIFLSSDDDTWNNVRYLPPTPLVSHVIKGPKKILTTDICEAYATLAWVYVLKWSVSNASLRKHANEISAKDHQPPLFFCEKIRRRAERGGRSGEAGQE